MADEAQYSSGPDSATNKRKYEEQTTPPPPRRPTGFSAPITSASPDSAPHSYNNVPPPVDEIQLAKQRAQEIAARLFNNASGGASPLETKRPRVENGSGFDSVDKGFSSAPSGSSSFLMFLYSFSFFFCFNILFLVLSISICSKNRTF